MRTMGTGPPLPPRLPLQSTTLLLAPKIPYYSQHPNPRVIKYVRSSLSIPATRAALPSPPPTLCRYYSPSTLPVHLQPQRHVSIHADGLGEEKGRQDAHQYRRPRLYL